MVETPTATTLNNPILLVRLDPTDPCRIGINDAHPSLPRWRHKNIGKIVIDSPLLNRIRNY